MYTYQKNISIMIKGRIINWDKVEYVIPQDGYIEIKFESEDSFLKIMDNEPKKLIDEMFKSLDGSDLNMQKKSK